MKCIIPQEERISSYKKCCDFIFQNDDKIPCENGVYIIWCHTHHLANLINIIKIQNNTNIKYIIVSHASDYGITQETINSLPQNIVKIFGQNIIHKDPRVESIPIGCIMSTWIGEDQHAIKYQDDGSYCHHYCNIPETGESKQFKNLVLVDFSINSNPSARAPLYNHFKDKPWATVNPCDLTYQQHAQTEFHSRKNYFQGIYNHKFVVSPLGNGVDCGRNWQSLYLNTIAIIPRHVNIEYYENDLPFLIFDDINTITEEYLNEKWNEMSNKEYNLEKATISYWYKKIRDEKEKHYR